MLAIRGGLNRPLRLRLEFHRESRKRKPSVHKSVYGDELDDDDDDDESSQPSYSYENHNTAADHQQRP
jgi:hypothetical protein